MARVFRKLTVFLPRLRRGPYMRKPGEGEQGYVERYGKNFMLYTDAVERLRDAVNRFCEEHPELGSCYYQDTLKAAGIGEPFGTARRGDLGGYDEKTVFALLLFLFRADHFTRGALRDELEHGSVQRLLRQLRRLDRRRGCLRGRRSRRES